MQLRCYRSTQEQYNSGRSDPKKEARTMIVQCKSCSSANLRPSHFRFRDLAILLIFAFSRSLPRLPLAFYG